MDKLVKELKKNIRFKETTQVGDHVLIASLEPHMIIYGLVHSIEKDTARKDQWWIITMHLLLLPPQKVSWTLREPQFTGQEIFTMQGEERFIKAVKLDDEDNENPPAEVKSNPFNLVK